MTYAYEIAVADLTEVEQARASKLGRVDNPDNPAWWTFRASFLVQTGIAANDERLTPVAATLEEWRTYVNTPGSKYTPHPTAEELAAEAAALKASMKQRVDDAVSHARQRVGTHLPFQTKAYELKLEEAQAWDGTGETPELLAAVADRFGITGIEAKTFILDTAAQYVTLLTETEKLREAGYKASDNSDESALVTVITTLNSIGN